LVRTVASQGHILLTDGQAALERVLERGCWTPVTRLGTADSWHSQEREQQTLICLGTKVLGPLQWSLQGDHNTKNALAAMAGAHTVGVDAERALAALNQFGGVKRRMEKLAVINGVTVYDDFAHHPTAIQTTLAGLRKQVGPARILAVLEPRSNTMKLGAMAARLPEALEPADFTFCYAGGQGKQALQWDPGAALAPLAPRVQVALDIETLVADVVAMAQPGDHVVIMSNGGFEGVHDKLLGAMRQST
jgi:UDP-N-acetylmuramate: L-alanyl-gamma-D-glutamyl-meso-diaminopimelate ligase